MNSRKASISHVMNDSSAAASSSDHHLSSNSGHSLRNLLSDDGPPQQHASSQQQYHHSAGNNSGLSNGTYGGYPNEQGRDYYSHVQQQQPVHNQPLSSLEQNNRPSYDVSADADEASKTLILLSQRPSSSHYGSSRDHYSSKDNTQQISDVEIAASAISSLSHSPDDTKSIHPQINQRTRAKNSMAISSLISGDESTSSDPIQSLQATPTSTVNFNSYNANNNGNGRKSAKRPLNGSPSLPIAKGFSKKSPQKRRPSDPNENSQRKIHRSPDHMPYPSGGQKYSDLREHPVEEQKPPIHLVPVSQGGPTNSMEWDHQMPPQQYNQSRSLHNVPPTDHPGRFQPKINGSPPMPADKSMNIKPHYAMNPNERTLTKTSPPIHPSNGYVPGVGVDAPHQPITQSIPQQNGQIRPQSSNTNFCRMYNDMSLQDGSDNVRSKEYNLPPNNLPNRPLIPESSPPMNNEHGMVNPAIVHHHPPPVNGSIYPPRVDHPGYPLQQSNPGYIHPEANPQSVQPRRVSDSPMHPQPNSSSISLSRGYSHHGPPVPEPQPPHTSHRHSIGSHHTSPSLLPTHIQSQNHSIRHNPSMPNLHSSMASDPQHRTPPSPLSRSGSVPRQPQTTLPPLQSQPSYMSQPPPTQGPSPHIYNGKSSPSLIPPQSPAMNHYHGSQPGLVSQNGSRLPPVGSHHHSSQPPEPVGPSNSSPHQILSQPLTNFLRDQPNAYGSAHPHNIQPNGLSPVGPPPHVGPLNSGPRSAN
ncbi:5518_t:CDS:10, partial [Dentiscutata heterogama]